MDQAISYYAEYVLRAQAAQLYCRDERRYLYLLRFVAHQYYKFGDALDDTVLALVKSLVQKSHLANQTPCGRLFTKILAALGGRFADNHLI